MEAVKEATAIVILVVFTWVIVLALRAAYLLFRDLF